MSLRFQVGELLRSLRGDLPRAAMARELGMTRQAVMGLERGVVSLERLEQLEAAYGVRFELVAREPADGNVVLGMSWRLVDLMSAERRASTSTSVADDEDAAP